MKSKLRIQLNQLMLSRKCTPGAIPPTNVVLESHSTCPVKKINNQQFQYRSSKRLSTRIEMLYLQYPKASCQIVGEVDNYPYPQSTVMEIVANQLKSRVFSPKASCQIGRKYIWTNAPCQSIAMKNCKNFCLQNVLDIVGRMQGR